MKKIIWLVAIQCFATVFGSKHTRNSYVKTKLIRGDFPKYSTKKHFITGNFNSTKRTSAPCEDPTISVVGSTEVVFKNFQAFKLCISSFAAKYPNANAITLELGKLNALCSSDDSVLPCNSQASKVPATATLGVQTVKIKNSEMKYLSNELFEKLFTSVEKILFDNVVGLKQFFVPKTTKPLKVFRISNTEDVEDVQQDDDALPMTGQSGSNLNVDIKKGSLNTIKIGDRLSGFTVHCSGTENRIMGPDLHYGKAIAHFTIEHTGSLPYDLYIDYRKTKGKLQNQNIRLSKKPNSLQFVLPPRRCLNSDKVSVVINGQTKSFENWSPEDSNNEGTYIKYSFEESQTLSELITVKGQPEDTYEREYDNGHGGTHTVTKKRIYYISININDLMQYKEYDITDDIEIHTLVLIVDKKFLEDRWDGVTTGQKTQLPYVHYQVLVMPDVETMYRVGIEFWTISIKYKKFLWKASLDAVEYYALLRKALAFMQPTAQSTSYKASIKGVISALIIKEISAQASKLTGESVATMYYIESAKSKIKDLILYGNSMGSNAIRLSRLNADLYRDKTLIYQDMAKNLIDAHRFKIPGKGQKFLLDIEKTKTNTQIKILKQRQKLLTGGEKNALNTMKELKERRETHQAEMVTTKAAFDAGVKRKEAELYLDIALGALDALAGLFSGNPFKSIGKITALAKKVKDLVQKVLTLTKAIKKLAKMIKKIVKLMHSLGENVNNFRTLGNAIISQENGVDPGISLPDLSDDDADDFPALETITIDDIIDQSSKLNEGDILQWDETERQVEGMMDASLSADIPETAAYKTALLKMISAGKAHTESAIKFVQLKAEIYMNNFRIKSREDEAKKIEEAEDAMNEVQVDVEYDKNLKFSEALLKFDLFLHLIEYCEASFYDTFQQCLALKELDMGRSLPQVLYITNKILLESTNSLKELYPPPQSFIEAVVSFKVDKNCGNIISKYEKVKKEHVCSDRVNVIQCREKVFGLFGELCTECLQLKNKLVAEEVSDVTATDAAIFKFMDKYFSCKSSPALELIKRRTTVVTITLNNPVFRGFERVRIDEIKVYLKGVETSGNSIEIYIENDGISQDRFEDEKMFFNGDKWSRTIRYKEMAGDHKIDYLLKGDIHDKFSSKFSSPTPFSNWRITVPRNVNPGLSLSKLNSIEVIFSGSFMASENFKTIQPLPAVTDGFATTE